jgi:hypothetical protein
MAKWASKVASWGKQHRSYLIGVIYETYFL